MAVEGQVSVISRGGRDYWRTFFIDKCEEVGLFGFAEKHLRLLRTDYRQGKKIYLEDAPYFRATGTHHRLYGPYEVIVTKTLPEGAESVLSQHPGVLYRQSSPELGPWLDRHGVRRDVAGVRMRFDQRASDYEFFPLRLSIRRTPSFAIKLVQHVAGCWLCR
jgi:hypothetical protein